MKRKVVNANSYSRDHVIMTDLGTYIQNIRNLPTGSIPIRYLGLPLSIGHLSAAM